ncbi:MAG: beta-propeller fold lactonase family protein, partial [Acidobacteria bacterium]|nr:beta-propeller fold lactonase family protein [Acidobacteriota bacterium]
MKLKLAKLTLSSLFIAGALFCWYNGDRRLSVSAQQTTSGPTSSGPIAITPDNNFVWEVNPDNDTVSVFNVQNDANQKVGEIQVGDEPNGVAIHPNGQTAYVTNTVSGTVSVINTASQQVTRTILVGTE